ncbi:MAG: aldehyde dehydrogenase family protein [Bacteroidales bacterium]
MEYNIYCGGRFLKTENKLHVINPYDGEIIGNTWIGDKPILEKAINAAQHIETELANFPAYKKYEALMFIADGLKSNKNNFAELLCLESAKPIKYAIGEIERAIQCFIVAAEESKRLPAEYISLDWTKPGKGKEGLVNYFPVGLVAGISPFNFPMNLAVHKIAPAIAAGCPIILKPSSSTPLSTLKLAELIDQTGLPKGAVSVIPMDRKTGTLLVTDDRIKLLSFTGSPEVGWEMKKQAGKKKIVLELGGNAGVIVTESADIEYAAKRCLVGGFAYSGQVCIHAQRMYVAASVFDDFARRFISMVKSLKSGNPLNEDIDISGLIDEENAIRIEQWVNDAVKQGATILTGGKREGSFYPPTVLSNTHKDMNVCSKEVFGPVVTLEPFNGFEQALDFVNDSRFGLQAGVFTNVITEMDKAFKNLYVGGVIINDVPTFRVDHMPYGGIKDSGLGREGIKYAMYDMLEPKILVKDR